MKRLGMPQQLQPQQSQATGSVCSDWGRIGEIMQATGNARNDRGRNRGLREATGNAYSDRGSSRAKRPGTLAATGAARED